MVQKTEILMDWMIGNYEKILAGESKRRFHNPNKCPQCLEAATRIAELKQMRQLFFEAEKKEEEEMLKALEEQRRQEEQRQFAEWKASQQQSPQKPIIKINKKEVD